MKIDKGLRKVSAQGVETQKKIVEISDDLFYRQGYEHTSFTNIAAIVGISKGNFYHHFKTKNQILSAVIEYRKEKTQKMLQEWESNSSDEVQRIKCFINILIKNKAKIKHYGCPVGTLTTELQKLDHSAHKHAVEIFELFKSWITQQLNWLGVGDDAEQISLHLLARSQGIATVYNAMKDERFLKAEVELLEHWVDEQIEKNNSKAANPK